MKQYTITVYENRLKREILPEVTYVQMAILEHLLRRLEVNYAVETVMFHENDENEEIPF